jgi:hypothetical protein
MFRTESFLFALLTMEDHSVILIPCSARIKNPHMSIGYDSLIYVTNEVGIVTCADAENGKTVSRKRLGGIFFASPVTGDGKLYIWLAKREKHSFSEPAEKE